MSHIEENIDAEAKVGRPSGQAEQSHLSVSTPVYREDSRNNSMVRHTDLVRMIRPGSRIEVYWPLDDIYYPATVIDSPDETRDGFFHLLYDDGESETIDLSKEKFNFLSCRTLGEEDQKTEVRDWRLLGKNKKRKLVESTLCDDLSALAVASSPPANIFGSMLHGCSDDILFTISSFIPTLSGLSALSQTCQRMHALTWKRPRYTESLLKGMHNFKFGSDGFTTTPLWNCAAGLEHENSRYWRETWANIYKLRLGLTIRGSRDFVAGETQRDAKQSISESFLKSSTSRSSFRRSVGILTPREEYQAMAYDHPSYATSERPCFGYFGLCAFNILIPCQSESSTSCSETTNEGRLITRTPVVVWGDFDGVRIYNSMEDMIYYRPRSRSGTSSAVPRLNTKEPASTSDKKISPMLPPFMAVATEYGLVLSVLACPPAECSDGSHLCNPCLFLGFASGMVMSICAVLKPDGSIEYQKGQCVQPHTNEVTALVLVTIPNSSTPTARRCEKHILASGSVDGNVYVYPHALKRRRNYSIEQPILVLTNGNNVPVLSMAAINMPLKQGFSRVVIITGDQLGNITLWSTRTDDSLYAMNCEENYKFEKIWISRTSSVKSGSIVTMKCVRNTIITGSNFGDVRFWEVQFLKKGSADRHARMGPSMPKLVMRHRIPAAHGGTLEFIEAIGNTVLTSGGGDGLINGWDLDSGNLLGVIACHAGRALVEPRLPAEAEIVRKKKKKLMSCVMGSIVYNKSLISMCRDGTLHKWEYGDMIVSMRKAKQQRVASNDLMFPSESDWISVFLHNEAIMPASSSKVVRKKEPPKSTSRGRAMIHSIDELKIIMNASNGHSSLDKRRRMQISILKASIERSRDRKLKDGPFLGADGKTYESLKRAFALFSGLKACQICRASAQGAFICRLVKKHELPEGFLAPINALFSKPAKTSTVGGEQQQPSRDYAVKSSAEPYSSEFEKYCKDETDFESRNRKIDDRIERQNEGAPPCKKRKRGNGKYDSECAAIMKEIGHWPEIESKDIAKVAKNVLKRLKTFDDYGAFAIPAEEAFPEVIGNYREVIMYPMDFRTIEEQRLPYYSSIRDLQWDLILVFNNCKKYVSDPSSEFWELAELMLISMGTAFLEACDELQIQLRVSDHQC